MVFVVGVISTNMVKVVSCCKVNQNIIGLIILFSKEQ